MFDHDPLFPYNNVQQAVNHNQQPYPQQQPYQQRTFVQQQQLPLPPLPPAQQQPAQQQQQMSQFPSSSSQQQARVPGHQQNLSINSIQSLQSSIAEPLTPPDLNNYALKFSPWNNIGGANTSNNSSAASNNTQVGSGFKSMASSYSSTTTTPLFNVNNALNHYTYQSNAGNGTELNSANAKLDLALNNEFPPIQHQQQQKRVMSMPHLQPAINFNSNGANGGKGSSSVNANEARRRPSPPAAFRSSSVSLEPKKNSMDRELIVKLNSVPFDTLTTQILTLSKDQYGCRFLQKKLDENGNANFPLIFKEIVNHSFELMIDPFGNYLIQKLLEYCSDDEKDLIIQNCFHNLHSIALNQHGTRALQKLIDCINTEYQILMIRDALKNYVVELIQDLNGNHVIQKCINKFTNVDCQFIIDAICSDIIKVSTHKHGCCVLQKCLNNCNVEQLQQLGDEIINNSIALMQDQFGNYVVQYLLSINNFQINDKLIYKIIPSIPLLSVQKFSSNVVEKCLKNSAVNPNSHGMMIEEILKPQNLSTLVRDQFGNYVVQTSLDVANDHYKLKLILELKPLIPQIKSTPFGRRIQSKISMILNSNPNLNHHIMLQSGVGTQYHNNGSVASNNGNMMHPQQWQSKQPSYNNPLSTSTSGTPMMMMPNLGSHQPPPQSGGYMAPAYGMIGNHAFDQQAMQQQQQQQQQQQHSHSQSHVNGFYM